MKRLVFFLVLVFPLCVQSNTLAWEGISRAKSPYIYILRINRHSSISIPTKFLTKNSLPINAPFTNFEFIDFGWGDEQIFRSSLKDLSIFTELKSIFFHRPAVIHVQGLENIPIKRALKISLTNRGFKKIIKFISRTFELDPNNSPIDLGPGLFGGFLDLPSRFYRAKTIVSVPKTCNKWTSSALKKASIDIPSSFVLSVDQLWNNIIHYKEKTKLIWGQNEHKN